MKITVYDHQLVFKKPKTQKGKTVSFPNVTTVRVDGSYEFDVSIGDTLQLSHNVNISFWTVLLAAITGKELEINKTVPKVEAVYKK